MGPHPAPTPAGSEPLTFTWIHDNIVVEEGAAFRLGRAGGAATLTLLNPFPEDSGEYVCMAQSPAGTAKTLLDLTVLDQPKSPLGAAAAPVLTPLAREVRGTVGGAVELSCAASGAEAVISWLGRDGEQLLPGPRHEMLSRNGVHTLRIRDLAQEDDGLYKMLAINGAGVESAEFSLRVPSLDSLHRWVRRLRRAPRRVFSTGTAPRFTKRPVSVQCGEGEPAELSCEFEGDPAPLARWFRGAQHLLPDAALDVRSGARASRLSWAAVGARDQGDYLCTIRNCMGEDLATASLLLEGKPGVRLSVPVLLLGVLLLVLGVPPSPAPPTPFRTPLLDSLAPRTGGIGLFC